MIDSLHLPPVYSLIALDADEDVVRAGCAAAADGAEPATLLCASLSDRLDCAVVLAPSTPLSKACLVAYVATLGLGDALGGTIPPGIDVTFRWPNVIEANMASAARIDVHAPTGTSVESVPEWLVLRIVAALSVAGSGRRRFQTTFAAEGAVELTVDDLVPSFARHFLTWMNRWEDDGFAPVRAMWLRHAPSHGNEVELRVGGRKRRGVFTDIDDDGAIVLNGRRGPSRIALASAIGLQEATA